MARRTIGLEGLEPARLVHNTSPIRPWPYAIKAIAGRRAYYLNLRGNLNIHLAFYVNMLEPVASDLPIPGYVILEPPSIEIEGSPEWEPAEVLVDSCHY